MGGRDLLYVSPNWTLKMFFRPHGPWRMRPGTRQLYARRRQMRRYPDRFSMPDQFRNYRNPGRKNDPDEKTWGFSAGGREKRRHGSNFQPEFDPYGRVPNGRTFFPFGKLDRLCRTLRLFRCAFCHSDRDGFFATGIPRFHTIRWIQICGQFKPKGSTPAESEESQMNFLYSNTRFPVVYGSIARSL